MNDPAGLRLRTITPDDAEPVARMWQDFGRYLRDLGDTDDQNFGVEAILRDGFGPDPAFSGIIAEREGTPCGYLLYHFGYDVDRAMRIMFVIDLWVDMPARRHGIGRALMREAAARCRARGGGELLWAVFAPNRLAIEFYQQLGAEFLESLKFMHLPAAAL
ncbi:MAG: GNAT family N-acetyltransferase [Geminicoccales bacterium]